MTILITSQHREPEPEPEASYTLAPHVQHLHCISAIYKASRLQVKMESAVLTEQFACPSGILYQHYVYSS